MPNHDYCCPHDRGNLTIRGDSFSCDKCDTVFDIQEGIPVFSEKRGYWSNVSRDTMRRVIDLSASTGDWRGVSREQIPDCERHISPLFRGDIHVILPISKNSVVLDAGSMWGGITLPLSEFCKTIYAVDQTWESLRFLSIRAHQECCNNVIPVESSVVKLPFKPGKFDLIILNGVLEWLATDDDVVLERDWNNKSTTCLSGRFVQSPESIQLVGLKELNRVLKDDGFIYIAIENRIGLQYFAGYPDDHVNIRFVSFLPRILADLITRIIKNHSYRTYLYSPNHLKKLVKSAGFNYVELYSSFPHYNITSRLVPFSDFDSLGNLPLNGGAPLDAKGKIKVALFSLFWRLVPNPVRKHLAPSIAVIAGKDRSPIPEIVNIFFDNQIICNKNYSVILTNNRFSDATPINFLLKNKDKKFPEYFCKLTRDNRKESLAHENEQLIKLNKKIKNTPLVGTVPMVRYSGEIVGREVQVVDFEILTPTESQFFRGFLKILAGDKHKSFLYTQFRSFAEKIWTTTTSKKINKAMVWLANFHGITSIKSLDDPNILLHIVNLEVEKLSGVQRVQASEFLQSLKHVDIGTVKLGAEHGDFDLCNVFTKKDKSLFIVDFEHMEEGCLPFFDLGNILFSSLVQQWKDHGRPGRLESYFAERGWDNIIKMCLKTYASESGVSLDILEYLPGLVAIRQFAKTFQEARDPNDYPLYDHEVFSNMIFWRLELLDCN